MTRNEAAAAVAEAFKKVRVFPAKKADPKAKAQPPEFVTVAAAIADPKAKGFAFLIEGHEPSSYEFKHGAHAHENRKDEVAKFRLDLVNELAKASSLLTRAQPEPELDAAPAAAAEPQKPGPSAT